MNGPEPAARHEAVEMVVRLASTSPTEFVELGLANGRILAEDLVAERDHPPFNRATMDGYAVRSEDIQPGRPLTVAGDVPAGREHREPVPKMACVSIATGAAVPRELDAVIEHERSDRGTPVRFDLDVVEPGRNIHPRAIDRSRGDTILAEGSRLGPAELGIAAGNGNARIPVRVRPRVALLSTGDELVPVEGTPGPCQIRDSNRLMLETAVTALGGELVHVAHVADTIEETTRALRTAQETAALVLSIGGVSAGTRDHIPAAWTALGARQVVAGMRIQPGRPLRAWELEAGVAIALPGNPVSALVCLHLVVRPWLRATQGLDPLGDWQTTELAEAARPNPRRVAYRPCLDRTIEGDPRRRVIVAPWHGSGDLPHLANTVGLVELASDRGPELPAGTHCPFLDYRP